GASVRLHGIFLPGRTHRVWRDRQAVHGAGKAPNRRLYHRPLRLMLGETMTTKHTDKKYEEELSRLREEILYMGGLVEDQIQKAIKSLVERDSDLASIIIDRDHEVNRLDVDIDELCIKLLAL